MWQVLIVSLVGVPIRVEAEFPLSEDGFKRAVYRAAGWNSIAVRQESLEIAVVVSRDVAHNKMEFADVGIEQAQG